MDEVAAAREVASSLRAAAQEAQAATGSGDLTARLIGLAERLDRLSAALERRAAPARPAPERPAPASDLGGADAALVDEGLALIDGFRLIPRPELRHSVLALVRALSPDRPAARERAPSRSPRRRHEAGDCA